MGTKFLSSRLLLWCLIGFFVARTHQASSPTDDFYNAGVVEFIPQKEGTPAARTKDNMQRMKDIIESSETNGLDILVFPEYVLNNMGLLTYVPDPESKISPCEIPDYDWFLVQLSCAARSRQLYIVINVLEKEKCLPFESCDIRRYNTNVVFDRQGRVISRYRKTHLYGYEWYSTNVMEQPQLATFSTDFGVTFGHFICFDMLFYEPAMTLVRQMNITDIIYPTFWFSELPFLTAVQLQEGWAIANDVNLLAADASYPQGQNSGSGIYAGRLGRLTAVVHEEPTTRLLTAKVPKRNGLKPAPLLPVAIEPVFQPQLQSPRFTKLALLRDYNVDIFQTHLLDKDFLQANQTLCDQDFCCDFELKRVKHQDAPQHMVYRYRLAAYSGTATTFQGKDASNQSVCAVISCTGEDLFSCGHIFPDGVSVGNTHYFQAIKISGSFPHAQRRLLMPSTVNGVMMPLTVNSYQWQEVESNSSTSIQMTLLTPQQDLLTFGIWANYYSRALSSHNLDSAAAVVAAPTAKPENSTSSSTAVAACWSAWTAALLLLWQLH